MVFHCSAHRVMCKLGRDGALVQQGSAALRHTNPLFRIQFLPRINQEHDSVWTFIDKPIFGLHKRGFHVGTGPSNVET